MVRRVLCALVAMVGLLGCGGAYPPRAAKPTPPSGGIEMAALPYAVLDARTGRQVLLPAFWDALGNARAICIGEDHTNPHHHWVQLEIVKQVAKRSNGAPLALSLEMIQRPFQGVLDDYAARRIDAAALRMRVGWEERWSYDFGFYGPTLDVAIGAGAKLLAANAAKELTKKVVRKGLESLTPDEKAQVPELVLDDAVHRAWFDSLMEGMGGAHAHSKPADPNDGDAPAAPTNPHEGDVPEMPSAERIYTVQVIWDETMADVTAKWLAATPTGKAIILAGNGHCHDSAIVKRLERRGVGDVVSVRPVIDTDVADALVKPMNDFVVVLEMPRAK